VLAGQLPVTRQTPGDSSLPTLTVYGGEITIDGVTVSAVDHNVDPPVPGRRYLLFLSPFGADGNRYQAVRGAIFEVENDRLRALLERADTAHPYADLTGKSLASVVLEITRARR
jgi:hypothetical protein